MHIKTIPQLHTACVLRGVGARRRPSALFVGAVPPCSANGRTRRQAPKSAERRREAPNSAES
eukprot:3991907-Alexandrium_andersonii.AAC.1